MHNLNMSSGTASRRCLIVLGMHRSGTSALTGTLVKLGFAAPETPYLNGADNPRGHWESVPLIAFHDELLRSAGSTWDDWREFDKDWYQTPAAEQFKARGKELLESEFGGKSTFALKDPRICRFLPFWLDILQDEGILVSVVLPIRNPLEVAYSIRDRDGKNVTHGLLLWLRHVLAAEAATRELPCTFLSWSSFLDDWRLQTQIIATRLRIDWPIQSDETQAEIDEFLTRELKHHNISGDELKANPDVHQLMADAYEALIELTDNPGSESVRRRLDDISTRFDDASHLFSQECKSLETKVREHQTAAEQAILLAKQHEELAAATLAENERLNAHMADLGQAHEAEKARLTALVSDCEQRADTARNETERAHVQVAELGAQIKELEDMKARLAAELELQVAQFVNSISWRLTKPLRWFGRKADQE